MDNKSNKKFTDFANHMRGVMCYLVFEFGYGTRLKQKSDVIPKAVESVFRPSNSHKTATKWTHGDATLTYGLATSRMPRSPSGESTLTYLTCLLARWRNSLTFTSPISIRNPSLYS